MNPSLDPPRWSRRSEERETLSFHGEQQARLLYAGIQLKKNH